MIQFEDNYLWEVEKSLESVMINAYEKILQEKKHGISGYFTLGQDSLAIMEDAKQLLQTNSFVQKCDTVVVIGIGGSSLGTKAIESILKHKTTGVKRMLFLENPDEIELSYQLDSIKKEKTLFCVVSKSGLTIETISIFKEIIERFELDYKSPQKEQIITITDEDSALHKFARQYGIKTYTIPTNVCGRFSVLSAVGIVPLTIAGYDTKSILEGASQMAESFFHGKENHLLKKAALLTRHRKDAPINVMFSYASCLEDFTKWYVQLWAESLGKLDIFGNHTGLTPIGHIGAVDQHSFLQLIMQGPRDKTVTFIKVKEFEKETTIPNIKLKFLEQTNFVNGSTFQALINNECEATQESLSHIGVNIDTITLDSFSEHNIGKLILYYELLTSLCGIILEVHTYNQPAVAMGKEILKNKFQGEKI